MIAACLTEPGVRKNIIATMNTPGGATERSSRALFPTWYFLPISDASDL